MCIDKSAFPFDADTVFKDTLPLECGTAVDVYGLWKPHDDTLHHECLFDALLHDLFGMGEVKLGVDPFELLLFDKDRVYCSAFLDCHFDDVGKVVLFLRIVIVKHRNVAFQQFGIDRIDAGIDCFDSKLFRRTVFLLNDLSDLTVFDDHSAVATGILKLDDRHVDVGITGSECTQ